MININGFDIDGVIHLGNGICGVRPGPNDVIITGRSYEEEPETKAFLLRNGIKNKVYFNPLPFNDKGRETRRHPQGKAVQANNPSFLKEHHHHPFFFLTKFCLLKKG